MKKLTVIVPCYNEQEALPIYYKEMRKIMLRMQDVDMELLFVDDGSTDNTAVLVQEWQARYNGFEIQYLYKENGGMHTAHNTAYENIHTELNVCID